MRRRAGIFLFLFLLMLCGYELHAQTPNTTTVQGTIFGSDAQPARGGRIVARLSHVGVVDVAGVGQMTVGPTTAVINSDGTFSIALIPNEDITPSGTSYTWEMRVVGNTATITTSTIYQVPRTPDPAAIGDLTQLGLAPGVVVGPFMKVVTTSPGQGAGCTAPESPLYALDTREHCICSAKVPNAWDCEELGDIGGLSADTIPRMDSAGDDLENSNITDTGTAVAIAVDTDVTGELTEGGVNVCLEDGEGCSSTQTGQRWDVVEDCNATGDGVTDDHTNLQACIDAVPDAAPGRGGTLYFPCGRYYVGSSLTTTTGNLVFEGEGGAGWGGAKACAELITDQAIVILDLGDNLCTNSQTGPTIKNLGFRDSSGAGTALGGLRITCQKQISIYDTSWGDFTGGFAWEYDGDGGWVDYVVMVNPRVRNCKYAYKKTNNNSDVTILGGKLYGPDTQDLTSIAIYDSSGTGGRLRLINTGINGWGKGIEINGWRQTHIDATFEQTPAYQTCGGGSDNCGTAIHIKGTDPAPAQEGFRNKISGGHISGWEYGIQVEPEAVRTQIEMVSFTSNTTPIDDRGVDTRIDTSLQSGEPMFKFPGTIQVEEVRAECSGGPASQLGGTFCVDPDDPLGPALKVNIGGQVFYVPIQSHHP